jgi:hypothetical protein
MITGMKSMLVFLASLAVVISVARAAFDLGVPGPGPVDGGLRLRLMVTPRTDSGTDGYAVRIDLVNVSDRDVTLRANWHFRGQGSAGTLEEYLEAATSIECYPEVAPWIGGVAEGQPVNPQPERALKAGKILSVLWQTEGRKLKNRVTNPNAVQNPTFPFPGLYSVHATLEVITSERTVRLRSNEQLVPVGGSHDAPRHTRGFVWHSDAEKMTALLSIGSFQQTAVGDQFELGSPKGGRHWKLTITRVDPTMSHTSLEWIGPGPRNLDNPMHSLPAQWEKATLLRPVAAR